MSGLTRPSLVPRGLSAHSSLGLMVAALMYVICLSGAVIMLSEPLQRWEQPLIPEIERLTPQAAQSAADAVLDSEAAPTHHFFFRLPTDELPRGVITTDNRAVFVDGDGAMAGNEDHAWTQFALDLHMFLHLPLTIGLALVGAVGIALLGLAITGIAGLPRIFRDAFTVRFARSRRIEQADLHNRASVWTLPFSLAIGLTGAALGLMPLAATALGELDFGGDHEAAYAPVFGYEPAEDARPAPIARIDTALARFEDRFPDLIPTYIILHEPLTAGQFVQIVAVHPNRLSFGDYYNYDAQGRYLGNAGMVGGTAGQQINGALFRLHFGSFGGTPVLLAYLILGLVLCWMTATGMRIWILRRSERGLPFETMERIWIGILWGTPLFLALTLLGDLTGLIGGAALRPIFWIGLCALLVGACFIARSELLGRWLRGLTGCLLAATGLTHIFIYGFEPPLTAIVINAGLLFAGSALLLPEWRAIFRGARERNRSIRGPRINEP